MQHLNIVILYHAIILSLPLINLFQQLRKLLKTKLNLNFNKIKLPRKQDNLQKKRDNWVYVCFRNEEDKEEALKVINGLTWKNNVLSATVS